MSILKEIKLKDIKYSENVRVNKKDTKQLMNSIKQHGLLQPVGITTENVLLFGHRRVEACIKLGWNVIDALVFDPENQEDSIMLNLIENIQRKEITPRELGRQCVQLIKTLTPSEISERLSFPIGKIQFALESYGKIPKKLRDKIIFQPHGSMAKAGNIPASVANYSLGIVKKFRLNSRNLAALLEQARKLELTGQDMVIIAGLMKEGLTLNKAIKERVNYQCFRIDIIVNTKEMNKIRKETGISPIDITRKIIYGELPSIKRPSFVTKKEGA